MTPEQLELLLRYIDLRAQCEAARHQPDRYIDAVLTDHELEQIASDLRLSLDE